MIERVGTGAEKDWRLVEMAFGDIQFDYLNVQRDPLTAKINAIAANWRRDGLMGIVVNRRDNGMLSCIDGQQRVLGTIKRHGPDFVERVHLYEGLAIAEEAEKFELLNGIRVSMSAALHFRAGVVAGKPLHLEIVKVLDDLQIGYSYRGHGGDRSMVCFRAMEKIGRRGIAHFRSVMELIDAAWKADQTSIQAYWLQGVSIFIQRHEKNSAWNWGEVVRRLNQVPADVIDARHKQLRLIYPSAQLAVYHALHQFYNKGRREGNRLEDIKIRGGASPS